MGSFDSVPEVSASHVCQTVNAQRYGSATRSLLHHNVASTEVAAATGLTATAASGADEAPCLSLRLSEVILVKKHRSFCSAARTLTADATIKSHRGYVLMDVVDHMAAAETLSTPFGQGPQLAHHLNNPGDCSYMQGSAWDVDDIIDGFHRDVTRCNARRLRASTVCIGRPSTVIIPLAGHISHDSIGHKCTSRLRSYNRYPAIVSTTNRHRGLVSNACACGGRGY